jgi:cytoskeletal protein CcmA (bactofilin family)
MEDNNNQIIQPQEEQSLETPDTVVEQKGSSYSLPNPDNKPAKKTLKQRISESASKVNIYLLLFLLLVLMTLLIAYIAYNSDQQVKNDNSIKGQILSESALSSLSANNTTVGDIKQTLTIASNSIFSGRVLVRDNLDVAGTIRVGGSLTLTGLTVANTSNFEIVQVANNLNVAGNGAVQGSLTVNGTLSAAGGASFGGPVTAPTFNVNSLTLSQDITLNRHIKTGGGSPNFSIAGTSANGAGGTFTGNGTDIAGTIDIKIGTGASCSGGGTALGSATFSAPYTTTPRVVISPVGAGVGGLSYYINRTNTGFTIGCTGGVTASSNFSFDYIVIQ